ncbi:MAG: SPFH/Band 7/PHB domain protein [Nitrosopumilus sp.]|nr:SPFH/Band 7/PHB domain protein [Nitrosopumilus sp.]MDH3779617.1 SPFH/Band 7/PHB domain protein [Nitrosopumilus sp.]MDH3854721.1 SPFH/Band 7/PHB domain protein [Nitrosopumilus sp.]
MAELDLGILIAQIFVGVVIVGFILSGIRIIRPTHRAAIETLGKYTRFQSSGITFIVPGIQKLYSVNITEQLVDVMRQEVITKDNLNCTVDAQVYFKVGNSEGELKNALYQVNNYTLQVVQLARTTLRNVIGDNVFKDVNSQRGKLNQQVYETMEKETADWGINIVRVELKEIEPPGDVQETMNMVIKAENDKQSAIDFANARETKADGERRASIKEAEGIKQALILEAEGKSQAIERVAEATAKQIQLVNESAEKYFVGNAKDLKKLEVTQASLENNSKVVLTEKGVSPTLVLNETNDAIIPTKTKQE